MDIDIAKLEKLAKIRLSPEEHEMLSAQIPSILDYVAKLEEVEMSEGEERAFILDVQNVFRSDEPITNDAEHQSVVASFPDQLGGALRVPTVKGGK